MREKNWKMEGKVRRWFTVFLYCNNISFSIQKSRVVIISSNITLFNFSHLITFITLSILLINKHGNIINDSLGSLRTKSVRYIIAQSSCRDFDSYSFSK